MCHDLFVAYSLSAVSTVDDLGISIETVLFYVCHVDCSTFSEVGSLEIFADGVGFVLTTKLT